MYVGRLGMKQVKQKIVHATAARHKKIETWQQQQKQQTNFMKTLLERSGCSKSLTYTHVHTNKFSSTFTAIATTLATALFSRIGNNNVEVLQRSNELRMNEA
uniref:Uncharacterized protein n=1 Tax=Ceratitis capitata TaxID=7213 RepID=W8BRM2_CERCA